MACGTVTQQPLSCRSYVASLVVWRFSTRPPRALGRAYTLVSCLRERPATALRVYEEIIGMTQIKGTALEGARKRTPSSRQKRAIRSRWREIRACNDNVVESQLHNGAFATSICSSSICRVTGGEFAGMQKLLGVAMADIKRGRRMRCGEKNTGAAVAARRMEGA